VLADAGVENVNAQADEHHWSAAPRLGLHGAEVLELHDRSVVAMVLVAACLGLRASEIVGLEWGDLNGGI
jgi:hypothetical protein